MGIGHRITVDIPGDVFESIAEFKKRLDVDNGSVAVFEVLKYALTLPRCFTSFDWKAAEEEAYADIEAGNVQCFASMDDFLVDLKA
ncbi:MAG: hypothetical protein ACP5U1_06850 [Desulfomonilaceae bacterium]